MILPDVIMITARLNHLHDRHLTAFTSFQQKPQWAKLHLNSRTLLTRFLPLSRTNLQKQMTTRHIKYRTSDFPFLLCILYVLVLFFFQVIIFAIPFMVNDSFPWSTVFLNFSAGKYSKSGPSCNDLGSITYQVRRSSKDTIFPVSPNPELTNEKFR